MNHFVKSFLGNQSGAAAIEYGLIAALIAVAIIPALLLVGKQLTITFDKAATSMEESRSGY